MLKKALLTLMATAVLVTSVPATTAYAAETGKYGYYTESGIVYFDSLEELREYAGDCNVSYTTESGVTLFFDDKDDFEEYRDSLASEAEEKAEKEKEEAKKAEIEKAIKNMAVCKHPSAGKVTLSASEKKGTLVVKKADIKTATKLDKLFRMKKSFTIKTKASSYKVAQKRIDDLARMTGHVNTYGVCYHYGVLKKGSYYTIKITKSDCTDYVYLCKAYENAFKRAEARKTGYSFPSNVHLCDCSDLVKARLISELIMHNHVHAWSMRESDITTVPKDDFKVLAGDKHYACYVCSGLRNLAVSIGRYSEFDLKYIDDYKANHTWVGDKLKDSSGKSYKFIIDNGRFGYKGTSNDIKAISKIMGISETEKDITSVSYAWLNK